MKRRTRAGVAIGSAILAAGAVTAAALGIGGQDPGAAQNTAEPVATEPVTRADLTQTQLVNGVLGYGTRNPVTAAGPGRITWLPALGATVVRGKPLYKTDNRAIPLLYGTLPLYRPLRTGVVGEDVREIEANLAALGYRGFTVDRTFNAATATAVRHWQKDLGLTATGQVEPDAVVVVPGAARIAELTAHLGDRAGGPVLSYAGTTRVVSVALDVALQTLVRPGLKAQITLPGGTSVDGTIASVGTVATAPASDNPNVPATIAVTVTLGDQTKLGTLDQAPVIVRLASATVANVLTVPVAALVALAEGGYGVQVKEGATTHYVAVTLGMFANGRVQISGDGIAEGMLVVVPS